MQDFRLPVRPPCFITFGSSQCACVVGTSCQVLEEDASNVKALYRRGCAYEKMSKKASAEKDLQAAHNISPDDTAIKAALARVKVCVCGKGGVRGCL